MKIGEFQRLIEEIYFEKDNRRGLEKTFLWFCEEVGELARAIRSGDKEGMMVEFGDVLAWLTTLASLAGIPLEESASRYFGGCPKCRSIPCICDEERK
jgi:NTP pyrophosphatase (non-canonical NTP hydrolase)